MKNKKDVIFLALPVVTVLESELKMLTFSILEDQRFSEKELDIMAENLQSLYILLKKYQKKFMLSKNARISNAGKYLQ